MPAFHYKAKKPNAETVEGEILAESKNDAVERIHQLGLVPVTIEESGIHFRKKVTVKERHVTRKELYVFSQQLVALLKAGVPILHALEIVTVQSRNPYFQTILESIRLGIKGGRSFSDCLGDYPSIFSFLYLTLVKAGEESGKLKESVTEVAEYLKNQDAFASKIKTALTYPLFMAFFGLGTLIFLLIYVLPQITKLFIRIQQDLPAPTVIVMKISDMIIHYWFLLALLLIIIFIVSSAWLRSKTGQLVKSKISMHTPFIGNFFLKVELSRFCRTLSLLMRSGVSIVRAIQLSIPVINNILLRDELKQCQEDLLAGRSFGVSLKRCKFIPDMMGHLVVVGEESGSLVETLDNLSDSYEQETGEVIKIMTTLMEPLMIIVVGAVVGFIVFAMLLPIFQIDIFTS